MRTKSITLPRGIEYDGVIHKNFTVREPSIADIWLAMEEQDRRGDASGYVWHNLALTSRILTSDSEMPDGALSVDNLALALMPEDYTLIQTALDDLKKSHDSVSAASISAL